MNAGHFANLAVACSRRPLLVMLIALALTATAFAVITARFTMTTDSVALISPDVTWRVNERKLDAVFPGNGDAILAVIDGDTPELAESAAVMSYLGSHPDWREDAVVRQLHRAFASLRQRDPVDFRALFEGKHPHRVPERYMAKLDACS